MDDLIEREPESPISQALPPTWCVVTCQQGCGESWTVDVADFEPRLTASDVERLLTPYLLIHEDWHAQARQEQRFGPHRVIGEFSGDPSCAVCHHAWPCPTVKQSKASSPDKLCDDCRRDGEPWCGCPDALPVPVGDDRG